MSIQGLTLEITVVACYKLKDTEIFTRQDPYVYLDYSGSKFRTRTCSDGGRNPTFKDEKFRITLVEGLREINVSVWNSNTFIRDDFIGSGRILLHKVIAEGYDDSTWSLQTKSSRYAGDVKVIMHIKNPYQMYRLQSVPSSSITAAAYPPPMSPYAPPPRQPASAYHQPPPYPPVYAPPPQPTYLPMGQYPPQRH